MVIKQTKARIIWIVSYVIIVDGLMLYDVIRCDKRTDSVWCWH